MNFEKCVPSLKYAVKDLIMHELDHDLGPAPLCKPLNIQHRAKKISYTENKTQG